MTRSYMQTAPNGTRETFAYSRDEALETFGQDSLWILDTGKEVESPDGFVVVDLVAFYDTHK